MILWFCSSLSSISKGFSDDAFESSKICHWGWQRRNLHQHEVKWMVKQHLPGLLDFFSCRACSAGTTLKSVNLAKTQSGEGNSPLGYTFRINNRTASIYCKDLVRGLKVRLELGTTFCVECHKWLPGCHSQGPTLCSAGCCGTGAAVAATSQLRWALRLSSLLAAAHCSQHGLCALTRLSHGDLKAGKTRPKTRISRRRQRDPNDCNTLTHAVIPSLSSRDKKADSPEPKRMFPAVLELQQRCECVCLQLNNTPEDSFVLNTTKYQHNQCFSPLALWNSFKVCSASQISSVASCSESAPWKNKSQYHWYSVLLFLFLQIWIYSRNNFAREA